MSLYQVLHELQIVLALILGARPLCCQPLTVDTLTGAHTGTQQSPTSPPPAASPPLAPPCPGRPRRHCRASGRRAERFPPHAHFRVTPTCGAGSYLPSKNQSPHGQAPGCRARTWRLAEEMTVKQIRIERPRAGREHPGVVRQRNAGKSDSETVAGRIRARRPEGCRRDRWPGPRWRAPADSRCSPARPGRWPWARPGSAPWHAATGRSADVIIARPQSPGWLRPWPGCHASAEGLLDSHWEAWFSGLQVKAKAHRPSSPACSLISPRYTGCSPRSATWGCA